MRVDIAKHISFLVLTLTSFLYFESSAHAQAECSSARFHCESRQPGAGRFRCEEEYVACIRGNDEARSVKAIKRIEWPKRKLSQDESVPRAAKTLVSAKAQDLK